MMIMEDAGLEAMLEEEAEAFEDAEGYESDMVDIIDFLNPTQSE